MKRKSWCRIICCSVQFSHSCVSNSLWPHRLQHTRLPCSSPTPRAYPTHGHCIDDAIQPSHPLSSPYPPTFNLSQDQGFSHELVLCIKWQNIGVSASASVLPMNIQDCFPLGRTGWISLQSKGISRAFCNTTVQKHWFFGAQLSL